MLLEIPALPVAGTNFSVTLRDYVGKGRVAVSVGGQLLLEQDCDDPPCHEVVFLTRELAGRELKVVATAGVERLERSFLIGTKEGQGGAMVAG